MTESKIFKETFVVFLFLEIFDEGLGVLLPPW